MTPIVKINSIDRTSLIDWPSFSFDQALTHQIDTVSFTIKRHAGKTFKPVLLDDVEIFEGATKVFGGKIVENEETIDGQLLRYQVLCKDHAHEMDSRLVVDTFENTTVDAIIASIITDFLPAGFTGTGVTVTNAVGFVAFNYEQPSKVFQQLAELTGADWFVDENKDIKFFLKGTETAPFDLNDEGGKFFWNSLVLRQDVKNLRNTIFVRGGQFSGDSFTEGQDADGESKVFVQGFRYKNITVKLDTVAQTVGIDNIDDPGSFDCLYNFNEKALKFPSILSAGVVVEVTGLPQIPVIIKQKDNSSISQFGAFEHKIIEKNLDSKGGARDRAAAEIVAWAGTKNEGSFETVEPGLRVGQQIRVNSVIRDIDELFYISRINTTMRDPDTFIHNVTLMTTRTWAMVEFLQDLLIKKDKEIEIDINEVLDLIESAFETINFAEVAVASTSHNPQAEGAAMGEVVTVQALDFATVFVYGPFPAPTGFKREGAYDGAVFG